MQVFHQNPFDGKSPHSFNDFFLRVYLYWPLGVTLLRVRVHPVEEVGITSYAPQLRCITYNTTFCFETTWKMKCARILPHNAFQKDCFKDLKLMCRRQIRNCSLFLSCQYLEAMNSLLKNMKVFCGCHKDWENYIDVLFCQIMVDFSLQNPHKCSENLEMLVHSIDSGVFHSPSCRITPLWSTVSIFRMADGCKTLQVFTHFTGHSGAGSFLIKVVNLSGRIL